MSVDRRLLNWGVFLVLLGGVPLAVAQGWIPEDTVARAWELWPLILIGAGVGLILSRTPLRALGGIIVAGTFGVILGAMLAVGFGGFSVGNIGCGGANAGDAQVLQESGSFEGGSGTGRVVLAANCASVQVTTQAGAGMDRGRQRHRERPADGQPCQRPGHRPLAGRGGRLPVLEPRVRHGAWRSAPTHASTWRSTSTPGTPPSTSGRRC